MASNQLYVYCWGNNPHRAKLKGRKCRVWARGRMNSCGVEFENGERHCVSRSALKKVK